MLEEVSTGKQYGAEDFKCTWPSDKGAWETMPC